MILTQPSVFAVDVTCVKLCAHAYKQEPWPNAAVFVPTFRRLITRGPQLSCKVSPAQEHALRHTAQLLLLQDAD